MTEQYTPQEGDRVKVTIEGVVGHVSPGWADLGANCIPLLPQHQEGATYTIEKLSDPEPEWVNGDVIEVHPYLPGYRLGGKWMTEDGEVHWWSRGGEDVIPRAWAAGKLEILYKADAPKAA